MKIARFICILGLMALFSPGIVSASAHQSDSDGEEELILDIDSSDDLDNEPITNTYLNLTDITRITRIATYHWNYGDGTPEPGTIYILDMSLEEPDREIYQSVAHGHDGKEGALNAYWLVEPDLLLDPGCYRIMDSDASTWSWNEGTYGMGITKIWGIIES